MSERGKDAHQFSDPRPLIPMRILITTGPTWEPIDAVRYIGNRSSGKTGLALGKAAREAGHRVTLLLGPGVARPRWANLRESIHRFETLSDLQQLLNTHFSEHDLLIMAAAVADYRPAQLLRGKHRREQGGGWPLHLESTPDLVAQLARRKRPDQRIIAFALEEPEFIDQRAAWKLAEKQVDAIVANPLSTIGADDIHPLWLTAHGETARPGRMSKRQFAHWLLQRIESLPG